MSGCQSSSHPAVEVAVIKRRLRAVRLIRSHGLLSRVLRAALIPGDSPDTSSGLFTEMVARHARRAPAIFVVPTAAVLVRINDEVAGVQVLGLTFLEHDRCCL